MVTPVKSLCDLLNLISVLVSQVFSSHIFRQEVKYLLKLQKRQNNCHCQLWLNHANNLNISKLFVPVVAGKICPDRTVAHVFLANCADLVCLVYQTCLDDHNVADSVYDSVLDLACP